MNSPLPPQIGDPIALSVPPPVTPPALAVVCPLCNLIGPACQCGTTPARDPTPARPGRFVKKGFYMCCATCGLTVDYCKGHAPPDAQSADGAESLLQKRINECQRR